MHSVDVDFRFDAKSLFASDDNSNAGAYQQ